jgi:hypothetical protein
MNKNAQAHNSQYRGEARMQLRAGEGRLSMIAGRCDTAARCCAWGEAAAAVLNEGRFRVDAAATVPAMPALRYIYCSRRQ